jgi:cytidylate kinase
VNTNVITIARGYGSGGRTIGQMLARKLDIPFYDRELLYMASDESGINIDLFGKMDETVRRGLFNPISSKYEGGLIPPESNDFVSDRNLFNYQAKIIKELADKGPCVIVGRCADFILRDRPNVTRVFVWAPDEDCVKNVMNVTLVTEKEARKRIREIDAHRNAYYRFYTGSEWNDVHNYDLCINSSSLGFPKSVDLIASYVEV